MTEKKSKTGGTIGEAVENALKQPQARVVIEIGDDNENGKADVKAELTVLGRTYPPLVVDVEGGPGLLGGVLSAFRLVRGLWEQDEDLERILPLLMQVGMAIAADVFVRKPPRPRAQGEHAGGLGFSFDTIPDGEPQA